MPNRGYEITWAGVSSLTIPNFGVETVDRDLLGKHRGKLEDIPGQEGAIYFHDERGMRDITLNCWIDIQQLGVGENWGEVRGLVMAEVANWLDVPGKNELIISDRPTIVDLAIVTDIPPPAEWRGMAQFKVDFWADPFSYATSISTFTGTATGSPDSDTFSASDDVNTYPVLEVTPTGGNVTSFTLTTNGRQFTYTTTPIAAGNTITITSLVPAVYNGINVDTMLTGAYNTGALLMAGFTGDFPVIVPGTNNWNIVYSGSATSVALKYTWRRRYRA